MKDKNRILFSAQRQVARRRVKRFQRFLSVCLLVCAVYLVWYRLDSREAARKNQELREIAVQRLQDQTIPPDTGKIAQSDTTGHLDGLQDENVPETEAETEKTEESAEPESAQSSYITGYERLLQINSDLKGWISIPGTVLSLPVVQGSDNSYYLGHDFYGEEDRRGTLFADCEADLESGLNTVIYGHHMRDGSMFGILKEYRSEDFYRQHPSFFISSLEGEREYEIFAVVRNDIFEGNQEDFQYYDYKQIADEESLAVYCQALKKNAIYDTGVEAGSGDKLVTLCTCDYGSEDQRLLVVGKKKHEKTRSAGKQVSVE